MAHSLNSPSSFSRRRACPASSQMERDLPDNENVYAAEGTAAHALGETCLMNDADPDEYMGQVMGKFTHSDGSIEDFKVDGDMVDAVQVYVDHCRPLIGDFTKIERKLDLPFLGPDEESSTGSVRGTADFISLKDGILHVVDYKHGRGVPVDVIGNIQGLSYGIGAANSYDNLDWHTLRITIVQPRAFHPGGSVRSWDVSREELLDWKMDFSEAALRTFEKNPPLSAGEHCRFCKAIFHCMGIVNLIKEVTGMDLTIKDSVPVDIKTLTEEQLVDILFNKLPILKNWVAKVEDYAQQRAEERNPLPDTKLVETRQRRVWKNPAEAEVFFKDFEGAYDVKFKSAPQIEKQIGKKKFAEYEERFVTKISTGVTLVPASDPRVDARPSGESEFGVVKENLFN